MKMTITAILCLLLVGGVCAQKKEHSDRKETMSQLSVEQKAELTNKTHDPSFRSESGAAKKGGNLSQKTYY